MHSIIKERALYAATEWAAGNRSHAAAAIIGVGTHAQVAALTALVAYLLGDKAEVEKLYAFLAGEVEPL